MGGWNGCCEACGRRVGEALVSRNNESLVCITCFHGERTVGGGRPMAKTMTPRVRAGGRRQGPGRSMRSAMPRR